MKALYSIKIFDSGLFTVAGSSSVSIGTMATHMTGGTPSLQ